MHADLPPFTDTELVVEALLARLPDVRRFVGGLALAFGFDSSDVYQVKMAVSEAVANAIEHGSSAGDTVQVRVMREGDALAFYVLDSGTFVPRVSPRGELPERGRGLEFMSKIMDEVELRPGSAGTEIRLAKRLT